MSTVSELKTLIQLSPELTTDTVSSANLDILIKRAQTDMSLRGRALPKSEKINAVADQADYIISGASTLITDDDFLEIDLRGGGVLFNDTSRWIGPPEFQPKTKEWLDINYQNWRSNSSASTPLYWTINTKEDASSNLALTLVDAPSSAGTNNVHIFYLGRGKFHTGDTNYLWTGSTTQLVHLEPYEILAVYYCMEYILRNITKQDTDADKYKQLYETGIQQMAERLPLDSHLDREGFQTDPNFHSFAVNRRRY